MSSKALRRLQEWLSIADASSELSQAIGETVSPAEVLRLAIDERLQLALYLPVKLVARCRPIEDASPDAAPMHLEIQGLCDVPMIGRAKAQIEHDYHWEERHELIQIGEPIGALVKNGDHLCQLPRDPGETGMWSRTASEFPRGSVLCVRRTVLEEFIRQNASPIQEKQPTVSQQPLGERERATLLTIIAALAKKAGLDISTPAEAAATIEQCTVELGARVSARRIADHLNRIPDALERRGKDSA